MLWSNGYATTGVLGHELGHNLGLGHSQELDCSVNGARVMDAGPSSCTKRSYWDTNDIMAVSWQNQGFLNASHLRRMGVLAQGAEVAPSDNGAVTLAPLATGSGQRVLTLSDGGTKYVVEYRAAVGIDSWMATSPGWGAPGVTVRREFDQTTLPAGASFPSHESFVLDGDPASPDSSFGSIRTVLPVGSWIDLADGRLGVRVTSQSGSGAVVEYRNGPASIDARSVTPLAAPAPGSAPTLSQPEPSLMTGAVAPAKAGLVVPLRWSWTIATTSDNPAAGTAIQAGAITSRVSAPMAGYRASAFRATASGPAGQVVSPLGKVQAHYMVETAGKAIRYSKGWVTAPVKGAVGSSLSLTAGRNVSVSAVVKARGIGVVLQRGARNGRVGIYVDGHRVAVLNMRSSKTSSRLAWSTTFATSGVHVVKVVNLSRGGHGQLGFDGLVTFV